MIFHVRPSTEVGFTEGTGNATYSLSVGRVLLAFLFLASLVAGALVAHSQAWVEGSTALLHMAEVAFGGIMGLILGEKSAVGNAGK